MHVNPTEEVIAVASRLKDQVAGLREVYGRMPAIIEKEHRAIAARDFAAITESCSEKEAASARIEALFTNLTRAGEQLARLVAAHWPDKPRPATLTQYSEALTAVAEANRDTFANQVLTHVARGLAEQVAGFLDLYRQVKPEIEANAYLVGRMMRNYQESYRFWQEVSEQLAVSYNKQGVQQSAGRNSGFKARA